MNESTTAQELRDLDNSPWNMPHYALRMQAANELEALQKEVELLKRTLFDKEEIIEKQFNTIKSQSGSGLVKELASLRTQNKALQKITDAAGYSGYGKAVTAEIERLQTKIEALLEQNTTLRNAQKACDDCDAITMREVRGLRTQNRELQDEILVLKSDLRGNQVIVDYISEQLSQKGEHSLIETIDNAKALRTQNQILREVLQTICTTNFLDSETIFQFEQRIHFIAAKALALKP